MTGQQMRARRKAHELTQDQLADKLAVTRRTISRLENMVELPRKWDLMVQLAFENMISSDGLALPRRIV